MDNKQKETYDIVAVSESGSIFNIQYTIVGIVSSWNHIMEYNRVLSIKVADLTNIDKQILLDLTVISDHTKDLIIDQDLTPRTYNLIMLNLNITEKKL